MSDGCLACDLIPGVRELPGGRIRTTGHWVVEHCVGPLGVGTLVVKPSWERLKDFYDAPGPTMQDAMFRAAEPPPADEVAAFCERARAWEGWTG